jgi:hypothetical protein
MMKKIILIMIILSAIFEGCRYEEGPVISFRTVDRRLQGEFQANKFDIDGQDAMKTWTDSICDNYLMLRRYDVGIKSSFAIVSSYGNCGGRYIISDNKRDLGFEIIVKTDNYPGFGPFRIDVTSYWKILKLSNNKLWLETTFDNHDYYLQLDKIKDFTK